MVVCLGPGTFSEGVHMSTKAKAIHRDVLLLGTALAPQTPEQFRVELRVRSEPKAYN